MLIRSEEASTQLVGLCCSIPQRMDSRNTVDMLSQWLRDRTAWLSSGRSLC